MRSTDQVGKDNAMLVSDKAYAFLEHGRWDMDVLMQVCLSLSFLISFIISVLVFLDLFSSPSFIVSSSFCCVEYKEWPKP